MTGAELLIAEKSIPLLEKGAGFLAKVGRKLDARMKYDFRQAHIDYCCNIIKKYCRARTFFIRSEPQFLEDFYVPASILKRGRVRVPRANLTVLKKVGQRCIVTGSGGSGKTIFMRHLLLDAIERGVGYPVFIELRNLNDVENIDLEGVIVQFMQDHGFPLSSEYAIKSLYDGLLVVLLDGFDEVLLSKRKYLEKAIKKLGAKSSSQIVISSRPDMVLEGWDGFSTTCIAPLGIDEACELIDKVRFDDDDEIKGRFIARLKGGLFQSHKYFLSNPLLLSIMLLTYGDSADIPKKFASFYEQAYTALFQKHDALKSGYRRERRTNLDIYEFSRLFSAFSAINYNKRSFRFSVVDAIEAVNHAKRISGSRDVSSEGFLDDARQAVCLLVEDGLDLAYVHRSFQEYFVAKFISDADERTQKNYIKRISDLKSDFHFDQDNVLKILYEINPGLVEDNYLIPELRRLFGKICEKKLTKPQWRSLFRRVVVDLQRLGDKAAGYGISVRDWGFLSVIHFTAINCCDGKMPRSREDTEDELDWIFSNNQSVATNDIPDRSKIWAHLAETAGSLAYDRIERVRLEYRAMVRRSQERQNAIVDIFDFPKDK